MSQCEHQRCESVYNGFGLQVSLHIQVPGGLYGCVRLPCVVIRVYMYTHAYITCFRMNHYLPASLQYPLPLQTPSLHPTFTVSSLIYIDGGCLRISCLCVVYMKYSRTWFYIYIV